MYCDIVVAEALRAHLPGTVRVRTQLEDTLLRTLPYVCVEVTGGTDLRPGWADRPTVEVTSYAEGEKRDGADLADQARNALRFAYETQRIYGGGSVAFLRTQTFPFEQRLTNQPSTVYRFVGTYELIVRPTTEVRTHAAQR